MRRQHWYYAPSRRIVEQRSGARKTGKPNIIVCPKCGKKGRVNNFRPYQEDQI